MIAVVVIHRIRWRLFVLQLICELGGGSAVLAWRRRVLDSRGTGSQLWWSLLTLPCGAYLWQQWVSGVELPRSWQQLCGLRLSTLVCPSLVPLTHSAWCDTTGDWLWRRLCITALGGLGFFCRAGALHTSGVLASETDAGGVCTVQDLKIGDAVLPDNSEYGTKSWHVERLQLLDVSTIQCLRFTTVEEGGENHSIVDFQFC